MLNRGVSELCDAGIDLAVAAACMKRLWIPAFLVFGLLIWADAVRAEPVLAPRYAIKLAPGPLVVSAALNDPQSPEQRALRSDVRRARALLMLGSGFVSAAVIHMAAWGPQTYCYNYDQPTVRLKTPAIVSSVAAGIGISLLIGGGIKVARMPDSFRRSQPASGGRVALLTLGALATTAVVSGVLFFASAPEMIRCSG